MSYRPSFDSGDWIAICDVCGRKFKALTLTKRWDGLMVCKDDFEIRQPQDFVRGVADVQAPPWTRPEAQNTYVAGFSNSQTITANYIALSTDGVLYVNATTPVTITLPVTPASYQILTINNMGTSTVAVGTWTVQSMGSLSIQWTGTVWQVVLGQGQVN